MRYYHFFYNPSIELYKVFHKILKLQDCKIYISKNLYLEFLHYLYELTGQKFICTKYLKFTMKGKIVIQSDRVRDGIFYVKRN